MGSHLLDTVRLHGAFKSRIRSVVQIPTQDHYERDPRAIYQRLAGYPLVAITGSSAGSVRILRAHFDRIRAKSGLGGNRHYVNLGSHTLCTVAATGERMGTTAKARDAAHKRKK